jgi:hypothetical protein
VGASIAVPSARPALAEDSPGCPRFVFDKGSNTNSALLMKGRDANGRCYTSRSWRSGSGVSTDPCAKGKGWLPNGVYDVPFMSDGYSGSVIAGRVWRLQDKKCSDGTVRTELFVHSEETSGNGQSCTSGNSDDQWCWDGTPNGEATNDYKSLACIKVRRGSTEHSKSNDLPTVHSDWHYWGLAHGSSANRVEVVN